MASIRNLKKDISFLIYEVISDVQLFIYLHPKKNTDKAYSIIEDAAKLYNLLYARTNHPDGKDNGKLVKEHYKSIRKDLFEQSNELFERTAKLNE
ncbi:MAG: hypothetical protein LBR10_04785 [Prevotellaceae bacterium]|jgi:hypothetical protein|nr:hypothetical protein [Prevotellaceae bacterium]